MAVSNFIQLILVPILTCAALHGQPAYTLDLGEGVELVTEQGQIVHVYQVSALPQLQELFEQTIESLMKTATGQQICSVLLRGSVNHIEFHLGLRKAAALRVALGCQYSSEPIAIHEDNSLEKLNLLPGSSPRTFTLLVVDGENNWPFDSWTEPFTNQTYLVLSQKYLAQQLSPEFLAPLLAHETAVYFDGRSWIEDFRFVSHPTASSIQLRNAILNPLIFHSLASFRAFHMENKWLNELNSTSFIEPGLLNLAAMANSCNDDCLLKYIQLLTQHMLPYSMALMTYSPNYLASKKTELLSQPIADQESQTLLNALDNFVPMFRKHTSTNQPFLNTIFPLIGNLLSKEQLAIQDIFTGSLLNRDLALLVEARISFNSNKGQSLLEYLSTPELSAENIKFSQGPRPRIRTGWSQ